MEMMVKRSFSPAMMNGSKFILEPGHAKVVAFPNGKVTMCTEDHPVSFGFLKRTFSLPKSKVYDIHIQPVNLSIPLSGSFTAANGRIIHYSAKMLIVVGPASRQLDRFVKTFSGYQALGSAALAAAIQPAIQKCLTQNITWRSKHGTRPLVELDSVRNKAIYATLSQMGLYAINTNLEINYLK